MTELFALSSRALRPLARVPAASQRALPPRPQGRPLKVLQSSRAPLQLSLFGRPVSGR